jgi:TetR/AcrR family transcriptional repressor of mexJK operon
MRVNTEPRRRVVSSSGPRQAPGAVTEDPRIVRSRAIILAAATPHFVTHGYVGANVDVLAAEAGVSKRTVYNIFGGKEQLFRAVLDQAIETAERFSRQMADELAVGADVPTELRRIGGRLARSVLDGPVVPLRRLLIGEVERFPEIAREYYNRAPGLVMRTLADCLAGLDRRGALRVGNATFAAEHFAFLVMGAPLDRALFHAIPAEPDLAEIDRVALAGVDTFLSAYGAERHSHS